MQALRSSRGFEEYHDRDDGGGREREKSVTFKEDREEPAFEPGWLKKSNSNLSSSTSDQPRVFPVSQYKYSKAELLEHYQPSNKLPPSFVTYPIITSEELLIPVALLPPELQDEKIPNFVRRSSIGRGRGRGRGMRTPWDEGGGDYVLGERRLPRHSIDAGDLGKQRRSKMWDSDEEDDDYKYENDEHDDDDDDEREVLRSRRRASVAVTQTHAHSKRDGDKPPDEPLPVTDDTKWMYRDPQGDVQGPFTNAEMNEWYEAGYFGPDLMVKRVEDTTFVSLRVMTKKSGPTGPSTSPFTITPAPKPREVESDEESEEEPLRPKQASKQHQEKQVQQEPQQSPVKAERSLNKSTDVLSAKGPTHTTEAATAPKSTTPPLRSTSPVASQQAPTSGRSVLTSSQGPRSSTPPLISPTSLSASGSGMLPPSHEDILLGERLNIAKAMAQQPKSQSPPPIQLPSPQTPPSQPKSQSPPPQQAVYQQMVQQLQALLALQQVQQLNPIQYQQLMVLQHQIQQHQLMMHQQHMQHLQQQQAQQNQPQPGQPPASPLRTSGHMQHPMMGMHMPGSYPEVYEQLHRWPGGAPPHELAQMQQLQKQQMLMQQQQQQQQQQAQHQGQPHSQPPLHPQHPQQHPLSHSLEQFLPHMFMGLDPQQQFLLQQQMIQQQMLLQQQQQQQQQHLHQQQTSQQQQALKRKEGVFILDESAIPIQVEAQKAADPNAWINRSGEVQRRPSLREIQEEEIRAQMARSQGRSELTQSGNIRNEQQRPANDDEEEFWEMPTKLRASSELRKSSEVQTIQQQQQQMHLLQQQAQQHILAQLIKQQQQQALLHAQQLAQQQQLANAQQPRSTSPTHSTSPQPATAHISPPVTPQVQTQPTEPAQPTLTKAQKKAQKAAVAAAQAQLQQPTDKRQSTPEVTPPVEQRRPSEPAVPSITPEKKEGKKKKGAATPAPEPAPAPTPGLPATASWGSQSAEIKKPKSLQEIQEEEIRNQQQQQQQAAAQQLKSTPEKAPELSKSTDALKSSGGVKKLTLREIQEEELRELQKRREGEEAQRIEFIKQQSLAYAQQNAIKWGNASVWSDAITSSPASKSLREIEEEEQKRKDKEFKKKEHEDQKKRDEVDRRKQEENSIAELLWTPQANAGKLSLREIQEQEKKREKLLREKEAANKAKEATTVAASKPATPARSADNAWSSLLMTTSPEAPAKVAPVQKQGSQQKLAPSPAPAKAAPAKKAPQNPAKNEDDDFWDYTPDKKAAKSTTQTNATPKAQPQQPAQTQQKQQKKTEKKAGSQGTFGGPTVSSEFMKWCQTQIKTLTGHDNATLAEFLLSQSADDVRDYVAEYVGNSTAAQKFANEFIRQREFETEQTANGGSAAPTAAQPGKKSSKKKMQKMDPNMLGFVTPPIDEYSSD